MTEAPACKYHRINRGVYTIYVPEPYADGFEAEHARLAKMKIDQAFVKFGKPLKPRSTGKHSSNSHIHGHAQQIASEVGESKSKIMFDAVGIAVTMYPDFRVRKDYRDCIVPVSESEPWSTAEAHWVIEALHQIASFCDVELKETEDEG